MLARLADDTGRLLNHLTNSNSVGTLGIEGRLRNIVKGGTPSHRCGRSVSGNDLAEHDSKIKQLERG